ncbi:MAG: TetR/AcrR family transcriptional regulator [Bdellovibrionales bacterium]
MKRRGKKNIEPEPLTRTITDQLFPSRLSRADQRKLKILEGAIRTYASLGVDYVSHEDIARQSQTSRPLVIHHFPDKTELFEMAIKLIRAQMQELAVNRLTAASDPRAQLVAYVESTFEWVRLYPLHIRTWLFYFYACASDPNLRRAHRHLTEMGKHRIVALLKAGVETAQFSKGDLAFKAKTIQHLITGALLELQTELEETDLTRVQRDCVRACLEVAGAEGRPR